MTEENPFRDIIKTHLRRNVVVKVLEIGEVVEIHGHRFRLTDLYLEHNKPPAAYLTSIIEEMENDNE